MRKIQPEELKVLQLGILDAVVSFCEENNIQYWLDSGTLLGAIRHKGYIPWDNDIDLGMLRPDFDRFMRTFNEKNERYKALCYENDKTILNGFIKVMDTTTVLYEPDEKGVKICVNIDVFVYDNAPDDDKKVEKMFRRRDFCNRLNSMRNFYRTKHKKKLIHLCKMVCYPVSLLFPRSYFVKQLVKNSKKYVNAETKRVGNFTAFSPVVCEKSVFDGFIDVEFEGKIYKAPAGYDRWLRAFYGDYMQLPPVEKRVPCHPSKAYFLDGTEEESK